MAFNTPQIVTSVTEGSTTDLTINLSLSAGFSEARTVTWQILFPGGDTSAWSGQFTALTGTVDFAANDAALTGTINIPIDDNEGADLLDRTFTLRLTHNNAAGTDEQEIVPNTVITLSDDDRDAQGYTANARSITGSPDDDDVYAYGTNETVGATGGGGDDTFVIHRFQSGRLTINDGFGENHIKLDYGVNITRVAEGAFQSNLTLTLDTGGTVEITAPNAGPDGGKRYSYQIGDGPVTDYAAFFATITAGGFDATDTTLLTTAYEVDDFIGTAPNISGNGPTPNGRSITGDPNDDDVYTYGTNETVGATGGGGSDEFIIHRFQSGRLTINDGFGENLIKLDYDVEITNVAEGAFQSNLTLTLDAGGVVEITAPNAGPDGGKRYSYQIGDGPVTDYATFFATITAGGFDATDTTLLTTAYEVPGPSDDGTPGTGTPGGGTGEPDPAPTLTDLPTIAADSTREIDGVTYTGSFFYQYDGTDVEFWIDPVSDDDSNTVDADLTNQRIETVTGEPGAGGSDRILLNELITGNPDTELSLGGGNDLYELNLQTFGQGQGITAPLDLIINDKSGSNALHIVNEVASGGTAVDYRISSAFESTDFRGKAFAGSSDALILTITTAADTNTAIARVLVKNASNMTLFYDHDHDNDPNTDLMRVTANLGDVFDGDATLPDALTPDVV